MRDGEVRELERGWRETRDAVVGARWVRALERVGAPELERLEARLETGDLDPSRLELAARLGHPAAREIDKTRRIATYSDKDCLDLFRELPHSLNSEPWAPTFYLLSAFVVARLLPDERGESSRVTRAAAEAWRECPCLPHAEEAWRRLQAHSTTLNDCEPGCCWDRDELHRFVAARLASAVVHAGCPSAAAPRDEGPGRIPLNTSSGLRWRIVLTVRERWWAHDGLDFSEERIRQALQAELIPWALSTIGRQPENPAAAP